MTPTCISDSLGRCAQILDIGLIVATLRPPTIGKMKFSFEEDRGWIAVSTLSARFHRRPSGAGNEARKRRTDPRPHLSGLAQLRATGRAMTSRLSRLLNKRAFRYGLSAVAFLTRSQIGCVSELDEHARGF